MRLRAFALSLDALLGLVAASAALALVAVLPALHTPSVICALNAWDALGYDYLSLRYAAGAGINETLFAALVGLNISETLPAAAYVRVHATAFAYPAPCGCVGVVCTLNKTGAGGADVCLTAQENLSAALKQAWVFR